MRHKSFKKVLKKKIEKEDIYIFIDRIIYSRFFKKKIFFVALTILFLIIFSFQTFPHFYDWDTDSPSFYTAAKGTLKQVNIYNQKEFQKLANSLFGKSVVVYPYLYWPILAQLYSPLTLLGYSSYSQFILIMNILLLFLSMYLIYSLLELKSRKTNLPLVFLYLTILVNNPLETTLHHGQVNILVFVLILLAVWLMKHNKEYASSLLLCLAVYLKIYPILFLVLFFLQKKYRYMVYSLINFIAIFLFSSFLFSLDSWLEFVKMGLGNLFYGTKPVFFFDYNAQWGNCSLNGFISQIFIKYDISRSYVMPIILLLLIVCFFLFKSKIKQLLKSKDLNLDISFIFPLSLIFSTISWNHHYIIMIFPLNFLFYKIISERKYNYLLPCLLFAFLILFHPLAGGFPFNQILLFSTVLFLGLLYLYHFARGSPNLGKEKKRPPQNS
ncbi:hypothetical protein AMJ44_01760 [candidate division WOR-1 bacterium DG_54_3]|uniref:DUF2029 domain-containing protein n=1 Tax=candidate division WOR-1 bacterium DG_54_3 TaxID=1703775 RepID=A0A0S7Y567_UNCSA|nr:MAG: hypothetical protein AMJ44_01760 [candidate division WOR-1 bacterium DG_54_3]